MCFLLPIAHLKTNKHTKPKNKQTKNKTKQK